MISASPASEPPTGIRAESLSDHSPAPVSLPDLAGTPESDREYRQRMRLNLFAAVVLVALVAFGILLANAMVEMEKAQGCYSSGQHTCSLL